MTDVEDFFDGDGGWRKSTGHRPSHVARIYVGGKDDDAVDSGLQDDTMSVFSEPPQRGRARPSSAISPRSITPNVQHRPSAILTHANRPVPTSGPPPTVPVPAPRGGFELAHVDTQINRQLSPDAGSPEATISAVDPALRGASKHGTNYHITLTLRPTIAAVSPRQNTMASRTQTMTSSSYKRTSPDDPYPGYTSQSPLAVSSMAVYTNGDPGPTAVPPYPSPRRPPTHTTRPSRETLPPPGTRDRSRSRSASRRSDGQIAFDVEVRSISDDDQLINTGTSRRQVTEYSAGPQISSTVEFTYSPPNEDQDPVDFRRRPPTTASPAPHGGPHRQPTYVEDDVTRSRNVRSYQPPQHFPEIQRGNFLITNSIDTTSAPKVRRVT